MFRACGVCGANWGKIELVCQFCEVRLHNQLNFSTVSEYKNLNVQSLFVWPEEDRFLTTVLYGLKGGRNRSAFAYLARLFHQCFPEKIQPHRVFVPAAPRLGETVDHARSWAEALAFEFDGEVISELARLDGESQKSKSLQERKKKEFRRLHPEVEYENLIFCDDVITSGNTAHAAYLALNPRGRFSVWTVAYRPSRTEGKSCRTGSGLL